MAGAWPELLAGATGRSNRPFLYFFLQLRPAPVSSGQLRPAPAKLWILIERLKFSKFLLNIFIYFCDADNVFINSQSVTVASILCTNTIELQLFWQNLQRPLLKRFD